MTEPTEPEADDDALTGDWFPVARVADLGEPVPAILFGRRLVAYRTAAGQVAVLRNRCPHQGGALHIGRAVGDEIECPYHWWRFGPDGSCVYIPTARPGVIIPKSLGVPGYPAELRYGLVWTCLGDPLAPLPSVPELASLDLTYLAGDPVDIDAGRADTAEAWVTLSSAVRGGGEPSGDPDPSSRYRTVAPGLVSVLVADGAGGQRAVLACFLPREADSTRIFLVSGTPAAAPGGDTARSPQDTLAAEMAVFYEEPANEQ